MKTFLLPVFFATCLKGGAQVHFLPFNGAVGFDPLPLVSFVEDGFSVTDTGNYVLMGEIDGDQEADLLFAVHDTVSNETGIYVRYGNGTSEQLAAGINTKIPMYYDQSSIQDDETSDLYFEGWERYTPEQIESAKSNRRGSIPSREYMIKASFKDCGLEIENDIVLIAFEDVFCALFKSDGQWYFVNLGA